MILSVRSRRPFSFRDVVALALFGLGGSAARPPAASAQELFWSAVNEYPDFRIRTSLRDGSNVHDIVTDVGTDIGDIAIDPVEERIYWVERDGLETRIRHAALDGTDARLLLDENLVVGSLAVEALGRFLYFTGGEPLDEAWIQRMPLGGGAAEPILAVEAGDLAIDSAGGSMYWVQQGTPEEGHGADLWRAGLDGSAPERIIHHTLEHHTTGITLDPTAGKIYWATVDYRETHAQVLFRADLDGGNSEPLVTANPGLDDWPVFMDLDLENRKIVWVNGEDGEFYRADLDGGEAEPLFEEAGAFGPFGLAVLRPLDHSLTPRRFRRGDADLDGTLALTDAVVTLNALFLGSARLACLDAADTNDDGEIDIGDAVASLHHQFLGGRAIPPPGPETCGTDPTRGDVLACADEATCGG